MDKSLVDKSLAQLSPTFHRMYAQNCRASIPREHLLKACLLMTLYSVRGERQFCERLEYDLLFKWFLDLNIMDHSFDHSVFAKNRQRWLLDADVAREFLLDIVEQARERRLLSEEHFSVDGTLLEAWASVKSFRLRDDDPPPSEGGGRNPAVGFRGERRRNETHKSNTDPDARRARKRVEEVFGWVKTVAGGRKLRYRGVERNRFWMEMTTAGYNLVRLAKLTPVAA